MAGKLQHCTLHLNLFSHDLGDPDPSGRRNRESAGDPNGSMAHSSKSRVDFLGNAAGLYLPEKRGRVRALTRWAIRGAATRIGVRDGFPESVRLHSGGPGLGSKLVSPLALVRYQQTESVGFGFVRPKRGLKRIPTQVPANAIAAQIQP